MPPDHDADPQGAAQSVSWRLSVFSSVPRILKYLPLSGPASVSHSPAAPPPQPAYMWHGARLRWWPRISAASYSPPLCGYALSLPAYAGQGYGPRLRWSPRFRSAAPFRVLHVAPSAAWAHLAESHLVAYRRGRALHAVNSTAALLHSATDETIAGTSPAASERLTALGVTVLL